MQKVRTFTMVVRKWTAHEERSRAKKTEEPRETNLEGTRRNQVHIKKLVESTSKNR
jgi:hypothetical protein